MNDRDTNPQYTGTGTPRSGDDGLQEPGAVGDGAADVDSSITIGATTSSHPTAADDVNINRSGSGGTGGASTEDDYATGSAEGGADR